MTILPPGSAPPAGTESDTFLLERLRASHVALDYEAVMETREMLRRWSLSDWPADDFTLNENLKDLEMHEREHEEGLAFTYTVLSPDRATCLGCVYLKPLVPLFGEEHTASTGERPRHAARVAFWVRQSRIADDLDRRVLDHLIGWFRDGWPLDGVVFFTTAREERQRRIFTEAGLTYSYKKDLPDGHYLAYL